MKSCSVSSHNGEEFLVIDALGCEMLNKLLQSSSRCSVDTSLIGNVRYDKSGRAAWMAADAFKFRLIVKVRSSP